MVIPLKRKKICKRFGFSTFQGVSDERVFTVKLDNMLIYGKKIHDNAPTLGRKKEGIRGVGKEVVIGPTIKGNFREVQGGKSMFRNSHFSHADVLGNNCFKEALLQVFLSNPTNRV